MKCSSSPLLPPILLSLIANTESEANCFDCRNIRPRWSFGTLSSEAQFDYVVIGGGTAGLAVAARLAENVSSTVAIIEAGGFYEDTPIANLSTIPAEDVWYAGSSPSDTNPSIDWGFVTTPQAVSSMVKKSWGGLKAELVSEFRWKTITLR